MKVLIKGGIWKNTEDEILKAAVSKYGKNQWARISSLLVRKTPKQCKARWYEWLDPSIKKTEWSKEEDEKLLHLAKLMPTQWRTIAPIVGRTPAQCLERYQRLLDEAEAKEAGPDLGLTGSLGPESGPSADDVRRLRPGEVDPEPETKPARPDPVDMDEDEKEMLSEARARLANTQGKKAKRKARERQLEEARRLASLQKRRELKAAGIQLRIKRKKGDMDYNADIPFEKPVPLGFYDNTEEKNRPVDPGKLTNVHLSKLNRRRADIEEEKQREKKRKAKQAGNKGENPEGNQGRFVKEKNAKIIKQQEQEQIFKRRKLVLPAPQVGEAELEDIVKSGTNTENARSLVDDEEGGMTSGLMGEYTSTPKNLPARTPRAPPSADNIAIEARNLRMLTETQTPLLGGENTPMRSSQGTGFDGVTPRTNDIQTPNPLLTPRTENSVLSTPRSQVSEPAIKRAVREALSGLPAPRNEYEIRLPELESQQEKAESKDGKKVEDMYDVDKRNKEKAAAQEKDALERRSLVIQRGLPRPTRTPAKFWNVSSQIESLVQEEYLRLITHDMVKYPATGSKVTPGTASLGDLELVEQEFTPKELADARREMEDAVKEELGLEDDADALAVKQALQKRTSDNEYNTMWDKEHDDVVLSAQLNRFLKLDDVTEVKDILQGYSKTIDNNRKVMIRQAAEAGKLEKKLDIRLGGYMGRSTALMNQINEAYEELETTMDEYVNYTNLQAMESAAVRVRVDNAEIEVDRLQSRNNMLQQKYKDLSNEKQDLIASIQSLMA
ncbi:pre-mRNA splicing factor component-domain-containing protein [Phascolomyces articulosus]|uniref:Pre-mRNA splicing factor component-domain-containing protein n=1 Tax=Phascolomyces articulosus TaxID=60185 RepID=A0AAD5KBN1_9FUNG|nr:pre-mRNA splicing factor component-domain-containing protein [Phascolomyces articulosus]